MVNKKHLLLFDLSYHMVGFVSNPELFGVAHLTRLQGVSVAEVGTIDSDNCVIFPVWEDNGFYMDVWHFVHLWIC